MTNLARRLGAAFSLLAAVGLALAPTGAQAVARVGADTTWYGTMQQGIGANIDDPAYYPSAIAAEQTLGGGIERIGVDSPLGIVNGAAINWATVDGPVNANFNAGIEVRMVLSFWFNVARDSNWNANWTYFVTQAVNHYKTKVHYWIIENEPDNSGLMPGMTAQQAKDFTCSAYTIIKAADPTARIESPPTTSPTAPFLQTMLNLGVTRCADVVGIHSYGGQVNDNHGQSISKVWDLERTANTSNGVPILPVANSEAGNSYTWAPAGIDARVWEARWHAMAYVQHKAWGYDSLQIFSMRSPNGNWDIASWNGSAIVPNTLVWNAILASFDKPAFANGGFESTTDHGWQINYVLDSAAPPEFGLVAFVSADSANAHGGSSYMRQTGTVQVRRVVEQLTPNVPVTVTAWVNTTGSGARVRLMGWDGYSGPGDQSVNVPAGAAGWRQVSVTVTPKRTWVVISLENVGSVPVLWDDIATTASGGGGLVDTATIKIDLTTAQTQYATAQTALAAMKAQIDAAKALIP